MSRTALLRVLDRASGSMPIQVNDKDWCEDPWTQGCYGAYMGPKTMTDFGPALRAPHGRIHWAGTETATVWSGYIEGAVRSGERAAGEVLGRMSREAARPEAPNKAEVG